MADVNELEAWITEQYHDIGLGADGQIIGKNRFIKNLFKQRPRQGKQIRQEVNQLILDGKIFRNSNIKESQSSKAPAIFAPNASTTTRVTRSSTATAKDRSSSAFVVKAPSQHSSDSDSSSETVSLGSTQKPQLHNGEPLESSSHSFKSAVAEAAMKSSVPNKMISRTASTRPNDGNSIWQFSFEPKQQILATPDFKNAFVALNPVDRSNVAGQSTSSKKVKGFSDYFEEATSQSATWITGSANEVSFMAPNLNDQLGLLHLHDNTEHLSGEAAADDIKNAVLFSAHLLEHTGKGVLPQYGLLGSHDMKEVPKGVADPRIFVNTNIPFSAFICGVQGSGKSHTTSCLIENCIIRSPILGILQKPLSALVFNYGEATSRPSEVAFLASQSLDFPNHPRVSKIVVLVSPSNYPTLKPLYSQIPGVVVQPFKLRSKDLNIGTMLTLMSVDTTEKAPLYMSQVTKILRDMASKSSKAFDYLAFKRLLADAKLDSKQVDFLTQRLDLLESFLDLQSAHPSPAFEAGTVTIMDLSCPFVDINTACVLFKIGMVMYLESNATTGKLIAVDEAHKYMTDTPASKALTESLLGVIRQQRHYGARVIISTQEPTISPQLIDLCSITVIHRFSSPEWFSVLRRHISIIDESNGGKAVELFQRIVGLKTGEALVFAPSAIVSTTDGDGGWVKLSDGILKVRVRKRVTWDGGRSVVAVSGG